MFQFRRFPTYTYLIQCTLHGYCPCGLPHSEISGSMDICSSPKLIAACHVLRRLLMPRHSPCALYSLTIVEETRSIPLPPFGESFLSAPSFSSFAKNRFLAILGTGDAGSKFLLQRQRNLVLLNYAGFTKIFGNCNRYPSIRCSTIKFTLVTPLSVTTSLLPYLLVIHCSVFKVQTPASFEARSQSLIAKALRSNSKSLFGGPEWARTTDLAIISRTL